MSYLCALHTPLPLPCLLLLLYLLLYMYVCVTYMGALKHLLMLLHDRPFMLRYLHLEWRRRIIFLRAAPSFSFCDIFLVHLCINVSRGGRRAARARVHLPLPTVHGHLRRRCTQQGNHDDPGGPVAAGERICFGEGVITSSRPARLALLLLLPVIFQWQRLARWFGLLLMAVICIRRWRYWETMRWHRDFLDPIQPASKEACSA